jgi:glycosyltransferase involved in cell wall biosynthesis
VTRPLVVGVDAANLLGDRRGIGRYVRGLLRAWHESFRDRIDVRLLVPQALPSLVAGKYERRLGGLALPLLPRRGADTAGLDLVWYPWNGMTWASGVASVVTIHDVWPFVSPADDVGRRAREQSHYLAAAAEAERFIAVSHFTKTEAMRLLGIPDDRIDVVPQGVAPLTSQAPIPARLGGVERYVLFVGESEPRKDVGTLVAAMAMLPDRLRATTALVIAGRKAGPVAPAGAGTKIEIVGEVSDDRLASLYAGAAAFVFPSRYEGFGLPVLEAMQYGIPVLASDAASIPEAGGDAARYFRAGDAGALAVALADVLSDGASASRMGALGIARAASMTVGRCAASTLDVFERTAGAVAR